MKKTMLDASRDVWGVVPTQKTTMLQNGIWDSLRNCFAISPEASCARCRVTAAAPPHAHVFLSEDELKKNFNDQVSYSSAM